jgi:hypothetical protein
MSDNLNNNNNLSQLTDNPLPIDPDEEVAAVYPVPEDKRISVGDDVSEGTDPVEMDQGDEEVGLQESGTVDQ